MTANSLKARLENACKDLWWSSETDYPVEVIWHTLPESHQTGRIVLDNTLVRQIATCEEDAVIEMQPLERCFEKQLVPKSWHTAEDKQQIEQLRQLKALLIEALAHPQVYRCGEVEITLCILGYVSGGIFAGVKTCVVET